MPDPTAPRAITLKPHQQPVYDFLVPRPFAGIWLGIGGGKTMTNLAMLQTVRPSGHILVIAPVAIARSTWIDEIEKWDFPIRTKSLIVDENDRKLSKAKRLQAFQEVFTDPPTMYFINQEMLTLPSAPEHVLVPAPAAPAHVALSRTTGEILDLVRSRPPMSKQDVVEAYRAAKTPAKVTKKAIAKALSELSKAGLVTNQTQPCTVCGGEPTNGRACPACQGGLIDQMPVQRINGRDTIIWPFPTVIIDESQAFKSHASSRFKALASVRPAMTRVVELTGTPAPNGLHDLWSQVYLLDQGQRLGHNITEFRKRWFTPKMVPGQAVPAKWIPNPGAKEEIFAAIGDIVMSAENTSLDMPDLTVEDVNVTLPPDLLKAYQKFRKDLVLEIVTPYVGKDGKLTQSVESVVAENQAVLTSKLMQFASGTIYTSDPDVPSTKGRYDVIHEKKLDMAEYLVRNNGGSPVLIAYHFRSDCDQLLKRFTKTGVAAEAFDGSRAMKARWNAGSIPVMLIHPASAGHGLNLQDGGHTMIWYTLPWSLEHYLQANGRLYRLGQKEPVTIYRLITAGTQDVRMPDVLQLKIDIQAELLAAVSGDISQVEDDALVAALEKEILSDLADLWVADRV